MQNRSIALAAAALATLVFCGPADAAKKQTVTGIDQIHAQKRVGRKTCFTDHDHYGEATMPSRKVAEKLAIRQWEIFTANEYGSAWGSYAKAVAKRVNCEKNAASWTCKLHAIPCRSGR
ncbi:MAG: hypothetical protein R3D68_01845 [Hyphomicrobiaceae bacterium]